MDPKLRNTVKACSIMNAIQHVLLIFLNLLIRERGAEINSPVKLNKNEKRQTQVNMSLS